ncbi:response regulator [Paenibacillus sp. TRM 82003]|nr:response regulator [Paenibacillus sp. TRM 82003]
MYRLLIVDDEAVIADGLFEVLGKFDVELDLCKAYSGYEALETMRRCRVDIVLTDIRMPGMDGLQLMGRIRSDWPHCKVILLTGYNEFDYVYKAIQSPGVSYLLKTEGYRKVKEKVRAAVEELDSELRMKDLVNRSQARLHTLETLLQGEYMRYVLKGFRGTEELAVDFEKLRIELDPSRPVMVVLGALHISANKASYVDRQEAALSVKSVADSFLNGKVEQLSVLDRYNDVLWLIQPSAGSEPTFAGARYLEGIFELIEQSCAETLGVPLAITLAREPVSWEDLPNGYEKLRQLQSVRVGDGSHMVQTAPVKDVTSAPPPGSVKYRSSIEDMDRLAVHLESGRREEFMELLDAIIESVFVEAPPSYAMERYYSIAIVLLSHMNRLQLEERGNGKGLMNFDEHTSWSEGYDYLKQLAESLFDQRRSGEKNRAAQAVDYVRTYIEEHLQEDLSLVRLAELIYFNPSYLSRLFKQECGYNLSEYIDERRLKKAKELLKSSECKIAEIGAKVGYAAPHSFTRFFKKLTGVTPQEYRDGRRSMGE